MCVELAGKQALYHHDSHVGVSDLHSLSFLLFSGQGMKPNCSYFCSEKSPGSCLHCIPSPLGSSCSCGGQWDAVPRRVDDGGQPSTLTAMAVTLNVEVYYLQCSCSGCNGRLVYDGQEDGIFNFSGKELFAYDTMSGYWESSLTVSPLTFNGHWERMRELHEQEQCDHLLPSRWTLREALWAFLLLLDVPYDLFGCPCCSRLPHDKQIIIADGISIGFPKAQAKGSSISPLAAGPMDERTAIHH